MKSLFCHKLKMRRSANGRAGSPCPPYREGRAPSRPRGRAACPHAILSVLVCLSLNSFAADYDIAAYVWPAYHNEPRWKELGIFADGKGEWQNLYESVKRTPDDYQGVKPLWGYEDESDPIAVARKIDAATAAGVNVFIYDWYWYGGRPFLEDALNKGFLGAKNCERMKFYIMYANHDVKNLWDNRIGTEDGKDKVVWPAKITDDDWRQIVDRWIEKYFTRPNYYTISGKPVLSIYSLRGFVKWEGLEKAKERIEYLRERVKSSGFPGLHLQVIGGNKGTSMREALVALKADSTTSYNWTDNTWTRMNDEKQPELDYDEWGEMALGMHDRWMAALKSIGMTYFPNISVGWDNNARYPARETRRIVRNSTPEKFECFARRVKAWADANLAAPMPKLITVNSWNEWTEGAYLEPDDRFGYGYLDALRRTFVK